jgi:hypothetical protein
MAAKRIRCICGRIFDPSESAQCPACGAEARVEAGTSEVAAEQVKPRSTTSAKSDSTPAPAPPAQVAKAAQAVQAARRVAAVIGAETKKVVALGFKVASAAISRGIAMLPVLSRKTAAFGKSIPLRRESLLIGAGALGLLILVLVVVMFAVSSGKKGEKSKLAEVEKSGTTPAAVVDPTPAKSPGPAKEPEKAADTKEAEKKEDEMIASEIRVAPTGDAAASGLKLKETIEGAPDGQRIVVEPGSYELPGTIEIKKALNLVGTSKGDNVTNIFAKDFAGFVIRGKGVKLDQIVVTQKGEGDSLPSIVVDKGAELELVDCGVVTRGTIAMSSKSASRVKATGCAFAVLTKELDETVLVTLLGDTKFEFVDCEFTFAEQALLLTGAAKGSMKACRFHDIGKPDGGGAVIECAGEADLAATVENCEFRNNTAGLSIANGTLTVTGGTFAGNGVKIDSGGASKGLLSISKRGNVRLEGVAFDSNQQGLMVLGEGSLEATKCRFNAQGYATTDKSFVFFCHAIGLTGKGALCTLTECDFTNTATRVASVLDGARLTIERSQLNGGGMDNIAMGAPGTAPGELVIRGTKISGFAAGGMVVAAGGSAMLENCELAGSKLGIEARDAGTNISLVKTFVSGNIHAGLLIHTGATGSALDCSIEKNEHGIVAGAAGNPEMKASMNLQRCTLDGNTTSDVTVGAQSTVSLAGCDYGSDEQPAIVREVDAIVNVDPPLKPGHSIDQPPSKKTAPDVAKEESTDKQEQQTDRGEHTVRRSPPRRDAGDVLDDVINKIGRVKRIFR